MDKVEILLPVFVPGRCAESAAESSPIYVRGSYLPIFQLYTYMKPHLPVSLFHALVAAVVAFPAVTFGGISDVPNGYSQITVTQPSDVAGSQKQAAFLLKSANNVSNFTITWNPAYSLFTDGVKDVLFTSWSNDNPGSINMSSGGKLLTVGDLTFVGLNNLTVDSSTVDVGVKTNFAFMGGVMAAGLPEISDETDTLGDLAGFTDNGDTFSIRNNRNINITRNVTTVDVATEGNEMRKGHALGGTLGGVTMEIASNKDVSVQANKLVLSVDGGDGSEALGCGGAVFGNDVRIVNNEDVVFQGNRLSVTSAGGGDALGAAVGALNSITIAGNDSVTFRNNGVYANFFCNFAGGEPVVACEHNCFYAHFVKQCHCGGAFFFYCVGNGNDAQNFILSGKKHCGFAFLSKGVVYFFNFLVKCRAVFFYKQKLAAIESFAIVCTSYALSRKNFKI